MKKLCKNFIICGCIGWCSEILTTSFASFRKKEATLTGKTSLFMFPIYGAACLMKPLFILFSAFHWIVRGFIYMLCIFTGEYISGYFLRKKGRCPWDYRKSGWNINGLVRLDFAPAWFIIGLIFERAVMGKRPH